MTHTFPSWHPLGFGPSPVPLRFPITMTSKSRQRALAALNAAIKALAVAREISRVTPATVVFSSTSVILTMIRVLYLLCYFRSSD